MIRRLTALAVALLALGGVAPAADAAPQRPFLGIVSEDAFAGDPAYRDGVYARAARLGIGTVRQTFDWATIEPRRGTLTWERTDALMRAAATANLQVLPVLFNPPAWASSRPRHGAQRGTYPPRSNAAFAAFAAAAARRYGPAGTFWAEHPELPKVPIGAWQIWNEPNLPVYWQPRPSARAYAALLRASARALEAVDPHATVVTAGLPRSRLGIPLTAYVRQLYAAGAASAFDALAVNPYARTASGVLGFLRQIRAIMDARGDRSGRLWATEIGWSDRGPKGAFRLGAGGQASAIRTVLPALWRARAGLKLAGVVYFNWRDARPYPGGKDFWGLHTGLLRLDGTPKPAYRAFAQAAAALR